MPKPSTSHVCDACGASFPRWVGKCSKCGEFGTVHEVENTSTVKAVGMKGSLASAKVVRSAQKIKDINPQKTTRKKTNVSEFDRILGGGLVAGQVLLLAGEPGVGKSTLLLKIADSIAKEGETVLIVSGEESVDQIAVRAKRMSINADSLFIADETDLNILLGHVEETDPDFIIVDSVQTIASSSVEGRAGSVSQVQEVATALTRVAKSRRTPCAIVAQITKDGNIAGPKTLEHLVDTVLFFEGDKHTSLRLLRVIKNRYGSADEVACFEQQDDGIQEVKDPSGLFLGDRESPVPGTCITVTQEGRRSLLAEVQALVSPTNSPNPRRGVSGLDPARMAMLVAVTEKHGRLKLFDKDTFLATVGGIRVTEPAIDLAVCLALASAAWDMPIPVGVAAFGEITLSGDVRSCPNISQRISEAARLGIERLFVPPNVKIPRDLNNQKLVLIQVEHVSKALRAVKAMNEFPSTKD